MPGKIKNIDQIKELIPDYVMGKLSAEDAKIVGEAINESVELKNLASEIKKTFGFIGTVKLKEPPPHYWTTILPRVHEKIEIAAEKRFSWGKLTEYWKIAVPAAAVILLAVLYFTVFNNKEEPVLTKKENKEIIKDTSNNFIENRNNDIVKDENKEKTTVKNNPKLRHRVRFSPEQYAINKEEIKKEDVLKNEEETNNENDDIAVYDEVSVMSGGAGGIDDEMDRQLNMLDDNQQEQLLDELSGTNL